MACEPEQLCRFRSLEGIESGKTSASEVSGDRPTRIREFVHIVLEGLDKAGSSPPSLLEPELVN